MGCVLHFVGDDFDAHKLAESCPVEPCTVWRKGEPRSLSPNARICTSSGLSFVISDAEFECFEEQQSDAIQFLKVHQTEIRHMASHPGVLSSVIDFGVAMRDVIAQTDEFRADLITCVGELGLKLAISQYPVTQKFKRIKQYRRAFRKCAW